MDYYLVVKEKIRIFALLTGNVNVNVNVNVNGNGNGNGNFPTLFTFYTNNVKL